MGDSDDCQLLIHIDLNYDSHTKSFIKTSLSFWKSENPAVWTTHACLTSGTISTRTASSRRVGYGQTLHAIFVSASEQKQSLPYNKCNRTVHWRADFRTPYIRMVRSTSSLLDHGTTRDHSQPFSTVPGCIPGDRRLAHVFQVYFKPSNRSLDL